MWGTTLGTKQWCRYMMWYWALIRPIFLTTQYVGLEYFLGLGTLQLRKMSVVSFVRYKNIVRVS